MPHYVFQCPEHGEFTLILKVSEMPDQALCTKDEDADEGGICLRPSLRVPFPEQLPPHAAYEFKLDTGRGFQAPDSPKKKGPRVKG